MLVRYSLFILILLALNACATSPNYDDKKFKENITPQKVVENFTGFKNANVLWGGIIISSSNLKDRTQLEVLGYPLQSDQKPDVTKNPLGRFLVLKDQYLETIDYAQGRLITLTGHIVKTHLGEIGSALYTYPVVQADQIYLWPKDDSSNQTRFHFGVGVMITN